MAKQKDDELGFAVPGMDDELQQESISRPVTEHSAKETAKKTAKKTAKEASLSLFWLLQHYSKENAAAYRKQQEKKKAGKKDVKKRKSILKAKENNQENGIKKKIDAGQGTAASEKNAVRRKHDSAAEEDHFGTTVMIDREHRPGLTDVQASVKAELECVGFGKTVPLKTMPFVIGRSSQGVHLCIADNKTVGRRHAVISYRDGWFYITDLKSLNHVYLDDKQIQPETETQLYDKARIMLGSEAFVFHMR